MIEYEKLSVIDANAHLSDQQRVEYYEFRANSAYDAAQVQAQLPSYDEDGDQVLWDEGRAFSLVANRLKNMDAVTPEVISLNGLKVLICMKLDELTRSQEIQESTEKVGLLRRRHVSKRTFESTEEIGAYDFKRVRAEAVRTIEFPFLRPAKFTQDYYEVTEWDGLDCNGLDHRSDNAPCITRWRVDSETGDILEVASGAHYVAKANTDVFRCADIDQQPENTQLERLYQVLTGGTI